MAEDRHSTFRKNLKRLGKMMFQGISWSGHERNCCYLNTGDGRFANISAASGLDFMDDARAYALVDWDHDGDVDLWSVNRTAPQVRMLRNDTPSDHHYLALRLEGRTCNRDAIGARVEVHWKAEDQRPNAAETDSPQTRLPTSHLVKSLRAGEGFLSQSSKWLHFGLGNLDDIERLVVHWPGGTAEEFLNVDTDRHYVLVQGTGTARPWNPPVRTMGLAPSVPPASPPSGPAHVVLTTRVPLPALEYKTFDGESAAVEDVQNRPLLVNLWASWCVPCVTELQEFAEHEQELRAAGLEILALSVDVLSESTAGSAEAASKLIQDLEFPFAAGLAESALVDKLEIMHNKTMILERPLVIPISVLIDSRGRMAAFYKGQVTVERLLDDVRKLPLEGEDWHRAALPLAGRWYRRPNPLRLIPFATLLLKRNFIDEGLAYIADNRQLVENDYEYAKLLTVEGEKIAARGDLKTAEARQREALRVDAELAVAHKNLGSVLERQGQTDEAVAAYRTAIELNPELAVAHLNLGAIMARQGKLNEALEGYREALRIDPTLALGHLNLGAVFERQQQWKDALEQYQRAVSIDPELAMAHARLGAILGRQGRVPEAVAKFREALRLNPDLAVVKNNLAWLLATHPDATIRDGNESVRLAENLARATSFAQYAVLDTLAAAYAETGKFELAVQTIVKALELARSSGQTEVAAEMEERLQLYQGNRPYRMESQPPEAAD